MTPDPIPLPAPAPLGAAATGWKPVRYGDGNNAVEIPAVPETLGPDGLPLTFALELIDWNGESAALPEPLLDAVVRAPVNAARIEKLEAALRELREMVVDEPDELRRQVDEALEGR